MFGEPGICELGDTVIFKFKKREREREREGCFKCSALIRYCPQFLILEHAFGNYHRMKIATQNGLPHLSYDTDLRYVVNKQRDCFRFPKS